MSRRQASDLHCRSLPEQAPLSGSRRCGRRSGNVAKGALLASLLLALAACARSPVPPAASTGTAAPATTPPPTSEAPSGNASQSALNAAAQAGQQQTQTASAPSDSTTSLERIASLPPKGQLPGGKWIAGTNYKVIVPAQPVDVPPGKVQVMEVFWYGCPHCYALEPYIDTWLKHKPAYIQFVRVPVMWADVHQAHARLFYTLKVLGKASALTDAVFDEIHQRSPLFVEGDPKATEQAQLQFAKSQGISASQFTNAYNSFTVQMDLQKAAELDRRFRIDEVPTIIVDGKYETGPGMAGSDENLIQIVDALAASEKQR